MLKFMMVKGLVLIGGVMATKAVIEKIDEIEIKHKRHIELVNSEKKDDEILDEELEKAMRLY